MQVWLFCETVVQYTEVKEIRYYPRALTAECSAFTFATELILY